MPDELNELKAAIAADSVADVARHVSARPQILSTRLDESGQSVLHLAAHHDARQVAESLLNAGAEFYARDAYGQLPLDLPPGEEMNDTRKWLRGINKARNEFLGAIHHQKIDEVKTLLAADKSLANARDIGDGWSGVMTACHFGNEELLRVLIAAGAKVDATDFNSGQDAMFICAEKGQAGCLRVLLDAGADVRSMWKVNYGSLPMQMNALHVASWKGHEEVVRVLLASKADEDERSKSYAVFSPLHFAATEGHTAIVKQLLAAGADGSARDGRRGITALEMAEAGKHEETATMLRGH